MGNVGRGIEVGACAEALAWCAGLSPESRELVLRRGSIVWLEAGETLFAAGEPSDALYVVLSGALAHFASFESLPPSGHAGPGETVGESDLLAARPRAWTVRALRDAELLRIPEDAFEGIARRDPDAVRPIVRRALERATEPRTPPAASGTRAIALLPQTDRVDARAFAERLAAQLAPLGRTTVISEEDARGREGSYFARLESENRFVVYVAPRGSSEFRATCVRRSDACLFLAHAEDEPAPWSEIARAIRAPIPRSEHLVLVHHGRVAEGHASRWLDSRPNARHHHVAEPAHVARLARLVVGRSVTLVLSGGGARGFAHVGVVRALRERGVAIDAVGGTSIGAVIGAGVAAEWSIEEMTDVYRRAFVATNPLSDYTLPLVSMVRGRKVSRLLENAFGSRHIEDLALPFFCVSSNLTEGQAAVHRRGTLWRWLRASIAIPGVLPPVLKDGRVYVDGSVLNNLPVDVMREAQAGEVIAVDIGGDDAVRADVDEVESPPWWRMLRERASAKKRPSIFEVLFRAAMVASEAKNLAARRASSLLLMPPIADVELLEWKAFDRAIERGYRHACEVLARATLPSGLLAI